MPSGASCAGAPRSTTASCSASGRCVGAQALRLLLQERLAGRPPVGFTPLGLPARVPAPSLPPFLCPDLEQQSHTWAAMLPDGRRRQAYGALWVNRRQIFAQVIRAPRAAAARGRAHGAPFRVGAVMDVYGTTKAIELLGKARAGGTQPPPSGMRAGEAAAPVVLLTSHTESGRTVVSFTWSFSISFCPGMKMFAGTRPSHREGKLCFEEREGMPGTPKHMLEQRSPSLFGTRDQFRGRQLFHRRGREMVFGMTQAHYISCALYFYYYPISCTLDYQANRSRRLGTLCVRGLVSFTKNIYIRMLGFAVKVEVCCRQGRKQREHECAS